MNIFKQFYRSIYSPKDIALFRFQGIGKTILYVFFLTFLSILPSLVFISSALNSGIDSSRNVIEDELPAFSIQDGRLTSESKVPVTINKDDFTIILDSTGAVTTENLSTDSNTLALLKNEFALVAGGKIQPYPYTMLNTIKVTNKELLEFIDLLSNSKYIIIAVISLFVFLFSSAASFVEVTVLALFGLLIKNLTGRKLHFRQLWRMAAYSETLPTLFFTIMAAIQTTVPKDFLINWLVAIIVLFLAINETPRPKNRIE